MNFAPISPRSFWATTLLHKSANQKTARPCQCLSRFDVKSTFAHKYFRTKWKPAGNCVQHSVAGNINTSVLSPCWLWCFANWPLFFPPAFTSLQAALQSTTCRLNSGSQHRRWKCVRAFAVPPPPETGHLCCQRRGWRRGRGLREQARWASSSCSSICSLSVFLSSHSLETHPSSSGCPSLLIHD